MSLSKYINLTPPESVQKAAERGLALRREYGRGGTGVGVARARDLSNGAELSEGTIGRMVSFFARHGTNEGKDTKPNGEPSNHKIAWDLWGGDAGRRWSNGIWERIKKSKQAKD